MERQQLLAELGLASVAAVWGLGFVWTKWALASVDALTFLAYRFLAAAFLLLPFVKWKDLRSHLKEGLTLGAVLWTIFVPQTIGLKYTSIVNSGFITGLFVAFVPFFGYLFFKRKPSAMQLLSVLLAVLGLWFLTGGIQGFNKGDALTLVTAVFGAVHLLAVDSFAKRGLKAVVLGFYQFLVTGALSLAAALAFGLPLSVRSTPALWLICGLVLFQTLFAFLTQLVCQKRTSTVRTALFFTLEPVFAAAFSWTIAGEQFIARRALGGFFIVLAMVLSELRSLTRQRRG